MDTDEMNLIEEAFSKKGFHCRVIGGRREGFQQSLLLLFEDIIQDNEIKKILKDTLKCFDVKTTQDKYLIEVLY